jgi:bacteriorhodopsin
MGVPDFLGLVATLREQMQANLSRSDVLRVLIWPVLILIFGLVAAERTEAPAWALIGIGVFAALFLLIYALAFVFLLIFDRDALRSEKYSLHKMAIEHGLLGDDRTGLLDPRSLDSAGRGTKQGELPKPEEAR